MMAVSIGAWIALIMLYKRPVNDNESDGLHHLLRALFALN